MSANVEPLHDQMITHAEKLEFIREVVRDWAADPGLIGTWTERTMERVFAGMGTVLEETADALRDIAKREPSPGEVTS